MKESGVYVLYDERGRCLYVGKSLDIHRRVQGHEYRGYKKTARYYPCAEDKMDALETAKIKELKPRMNRAKTGIKRRVGAGRTSVSLCESDFVYIERWRKALRKTHGEVSTKFILRTALLALAEKLGVAA